MLSRVELCRAVCSHASAVVTQFPITQVYTQPVAVGWDIGVGDGGRGARARPPLPPKIRVKNFRAIFI